MDASEARSVCTLDRAMDLVVFLRANCPWDRKQTPRTLAKHLVEESHEVAEAIVGGDAGALAEELGDLLLNLAFQLVVAEEAGAFTRGDVWERLDRKMQERHPHLFGLGEEAGSWDELKEAGGAEAEGALGSVPSRLPPLAKAYLMQRRASRVGFDWSDPHGALDKVREETREVEDQLTQGEGDLEEELGDLLFSVVNVARWADVDPSSALTSANLKFKRRFTAVEARARSLGLPMPGTDLEVLDRLWDEAKAGEGQ